jgi:hypothetical protein
LGLRPRDCGAGLAFARQPLIYPYVALVGDMKQGQLQRLQQFPVQGVQAAQFGGGLFWEEAFMPAIKRISQPHGFGLIHLFFPFLILQVIHRDLGLATASLLSGNGFDNLSLCVNFCSINDASNLNIIKQVHSLRIADENAVSIPQMLWHHRIFVGQSLLKRCKRHLQLLQNIFGDSIASLHGHGSPGDWLGRGSAIAKCQGDVNLIECSFTLMIF